MLNNRQRDDFEDRVDDSIHQNELRKQDARKLTCELSPAGNIAAVSQVRPVELPTNVPLTVAEWRDRKLAEPDFLCGNWLTTTSRVLVTAATGLGKTNFAIALGQTVSRGAGFLHWHGRRPANVLYIDGEMSARLLRARLIDEAARHGDDPEYFYALSHEDVPAFSPLNTAEGQDAIEQLIAEIGSVDLIIFDNIMCLIAGDQKETLPWQQTLPWALSLTQRGIGQIWIHHTGHDETRGYGDKAREWQMDTVIHLETAKRDDTDVSFTLQFRKARERTPTIRFDFQEVKIALVNDRWEHELSSARRPGRLAPRVQKALEALTTVLAGDRASMLPGNRRAAHRDDWAAECNARRLIDLKRNANSARTLMNTFRRELVVANRIACEEDLQWLL
ncbi:AAA family ATPase [Bradyrhizobium septentrionale]|uniref:AAA family ATPase n=1 Tax=Bradyrhizobium septentrionale TaxID=1404411 RepID=UPI0030D4ADC5